MFVNHLTYYLKFDLIMAKNSQETRFLHKRYRTADHRMDRPSYEDAFLIDASEKKWHKWNSDFLSVIGGFPLLMVHYYGV